LGGLAVPDQGAGDGVDKGPAGVPAEGVEGFVGGQVEEGRLVGGGGVALILPATGPVRQDRFDQVPDGAVRFQSRPEIMGDPAVSALSR
jgi:hypothetical protein